ncbi:MAG: EAL domain-containing protein [Gammaproteobacteria bacterium]|jgi:diguanylate cyclase (GGDEF)-like protein/PAS domain S-box-containing protein
MISEPSVPHPHLVLKAIGDAIITANVQGLIDYLNPAAEEMTGWPLADASGRRLETIVSIVDEHGRKRRPLTAVQCEQQGGVMNLPQYGILISRSGREFAIQHSISLLYDEHGRVVGSVLVFSDVTRTRSQWQKVVRPAAHDPLTGLVNRHEFERRLDRALSSAQEQGVRHMLGYLDLDNFQLVNDNCGHDAGDNLLRQVANLLLDKLRARDTLARIGGDAFALLLENCPEHKASQIAESMIDAIRQITFRLGDDQRALGASIGLVPVTAESQDVQVLLNQADVACSTAKRRGDNRAHIHVLSRDTLPYQPSHGSHVARLQDALANNRFELYAQPIVALSAQAEQPLHYELLLRLLDRRNQVIPPEAFIPTAERYGLMTAIDRWVIRTALHDAAPVLNGLPQSGIVINLSGTSLNDASLLDFVRDQLANSAVAAHRICFEITETAAINSLTQAAQLIHAIKTMGCRFALDDFGSGLSSFVYLKHLPVDYLKIDGSFVRDMVQDTVDQAIVAAMNKVGHLMGIQTIAECVENEAIVEMLKSFGVDYAQGYNIGRPRPLQSMAR